jgi:threonine/homoserine/homoserine lactone efflux protein
MSEPGFLQWLGKGLLIGFSIAAPVGPIGVLCIRRSLAEGRQIGLATGLGAATADAAYGCVAAFGLTAISGALVRQAFWLGLIGGGFLCFLGVRTLLSRPAQNAARQGESGLWGAYLSTLVLTLTNPMTILSFVAVFAGIGFGISAGYRNAGVLVAGVFAGSALWWVLLSNGAAYFRTRMTDGWMRMINRTSGLIILGFGVYALITVFSK